MWLIFSGLPGQISTAIFRQHFGTALHRLQQITSKPRANLANKKDRVLRSRCIFWKEYPFKVLNFWFKINFLGSALTAQQGAALTSSYGSDGMGEVSTGMASTAFTGQRSQPMDAARQLFLVDDTALSGHSALPGLLGPPGPVISLGCHTWGYPQGSGNGARAP